ncbi:MAG: hypothetical protein A3J49_19010 [Gallionellales bacterium RIFCSPHIGHO2_02_FULL_57_16]|nr:MAG: hypothetical protein A3J49_19010 [Gallionellales bacterium RIFCSPHIGHO2_02_FULL_57_16]
MIHPKLSKPGMIANAYSKIQIVDTHESLETLINIDIAVGMTQFNRTLVNLTITYKANHTDRINSNIKLKPLMFLPTAHADWLPRSGH